MMRVYLAGPMRGKEHYNFNTFEDWTVKLRELGHWVESPHNHDIAQGRVRAKWIGSALHRTFSEVVLLDTFDYEAVLRYDFHLILDCDAIVMLPDWRDSHGATRELTLAVATGKRVLFVEDDELVDVTDQVLIDGSSLVRL